MKNLKLIILFLIINFGALGLGSWLMSDGPRSEWYMQLAQAPWTPPGWVFGAAWTFIMICFSVYMAFLYRKVPTSQVISLFIVQFILNVSWNYVFFNQHNILLGLVIIGLLTLLVAYFLLHFHKIMKWNSLLIAPYLIWLCIATSLNAYILIYN